MPKDVTVGDHIFIVMDVDNHTDPTAHVYADADEAIEFARSEARARNSDPESLDERLTPAMTSLNWLYYCSYSGNGDALWVVRRTLK